MSSIQKINNIGKVTTATFQANESPVTPGYYMTSSYGYDSFTPSFGSRNGAVVKNIGMAAKSTGNGLKSKFNKFIVGGLTGLMLATTACRPRPVEPFNNTVNVEVTSNITISEEELYSYLQQILEAIQQGNDQNAAFFNRIIAILAENGVGINTIISYLELNEQHLHDLVDDNEELKEVLLNIEALLATLQAQHQALGEAQNVLLSQILSVVMNLNANNNTNQEAIIALLNQLINQMAQMNNQQAAYYTSVLNALNHMEQTLQASLVAILNAIQNMDENMQTGHLAILAQLQGMEATLQAGLLQVLNHIDQFSAQVQAKLNALIALAGQMNQTMLNCTAQILAQMQEWQDAQQQMALDILTAMQSMGGNLQQHYAALMNMIQDLGTTQQAQLLAILNQMIHMEDEQEQQYLSILAALQNQSGENLAPILLQILAQMQNMQAAQEQQYLNVMSQLQNMAQAAHADFLALMAKLMNMQGGQDAILNAIQALNADFLAMFSQALASLDNIEQNQVTQITQLADILAAIQNGTASINEIKDMIANLNINPQVDLSAIESLLEQILASQNTANNLLQNIDDNLTLINTTSQALYQKMIQVTDNQDVINDWLENIFNKIPAATQGCNCGDCCEQLINILIQIDQHIQELDWNHEGIDDDLDPLLGK